MGVLAVAGSPLGAWPLLASAATTTAFIVPVPVAIPVAVVTGRAEHGRGQQARHGLPGQRLKQRSHESSSACPNPSGRLDVRSGRMVCITNGLVAYLT